MIQEEINSLPSDVQKDFNGKTIEVYESAGCEACKGKGISGRVALFEILEMTKELGEVVAQKKGEGAIVAEAKRQHMITMRQDGVAKALLGLVSIESVLRETETF